MLKRKNKMTFTSDRDNLKNGEPAKRKPLRLLPGVIIVVLQWLLWLAVPAIVPEDMGTIVGVFGGMLGGLAVIVWWIFFSRASRLERWGAIVLMIVAPVVTSQLLHKSIATGNMGLMFPFHVIPVLSLAFVVWAVATRRFSDRFRRATMVATILLACGAWTLVRSDGIIDSTNALFTWRWAPTAEERLLARGGDETSVLPEATAIVETKSDWPGFRGPGRDGIVHGVRIATDWSASPPVELWRRPIGPGCSSFAVRGELLYTQEQRGDDEVVACYLLNTGEPVWKHRDAARFWDSHAGAGPRGTPTLSDGRVYTLGATGILNVLDARDGSVVWSRNAATDTNTPIPMWGITSSPLVVGNVVIVAVEGTLAAYDLATGAPRWSGPNGGKTYSSPHLVTIDGITQVVLMSNVGATSFAPADGTLLWEYPWEGEDRIVQPAMTKDGDLLLCAGGLSFGVRRIAVKHGPDGWKIQERWESSELQPNFNDTVVHEGYAYGFVGPRLACIDVKDGTRKWKDARYAGFSILLADQGVLLVLSEKGELALVNAVPEKFTELARIQAVGGKTWNHPALAGNILLVRNAVEMAAYRLPLAGG
jgi:outer membrane protein assembly factor BamB